MTAADGDALSAWPQAALLTCASALDTTVAASSDIPDMAGIAAAAIALPTPLRIRHRAKSRRKAMRGIGTGYDTARACNVNKLSIGARLERLAGFRAAGKTPTQVSIGSPSKCSEELQWRTGRTPAMSSAIPKIPRN